MKAIFIGFLGAALVPPTSAKFIGTTFYEPEVMLQMCKSDVARGEAGFCTGYVIATEAGMRGSGEVCMPDGIEYEDMVRVVIDRIEDVLKQNRDRRSIHSGYETQVALRLAWPCKK